MSIRETCIHYTGTKLTNRGYGRYKYKGKMTLVHRLAYCIANNVSLESIKDSVVRHKCDVPNCVNPAHLELGTQADNIRDMNDRGRQRTVHGEDSPHAKLTAKDVKYIREHYKRGCRINGFSALARKFKVSDVVIAHVANNTQWRHI